MQICCSLLPTAHCPLPTALAASERRSHATLARRIGRGSAGAGGAGVRPAASVGDDRERAGRLSDAREQRHRLAAYMALRVVLERWGGAQVRGQRFIRSASGKPQSGHGRPGLQPVAYRRLGPHRRRPVASHRCRSRADADRGHVAAPPGGDRGRRRRVCGSAGGRCRQRRRRAAGLVSARGLRQGQGAGGCAPVERARSARDPRPAARPCRYRGRRARARARGRPVESAT